MAISINPREDFRLVDNLETITYYSRLTDTTYDTAVTIPNCLRRAQRKNLQQGGDWIAVASLTWHLWKANMPTALIPKAMDKIVDSAGISWIVEPVEYATWTTRYALQCKKLGTGG